ncbi:hypothetical protein F3J23_12845 [Chryseobacterium sp. Tr-659]|uniref:hypothetical protein n=1 Tax=Chryseobacterium sp. Tr-659 TaxID=2608340 RepID=UPI001424957F|nr:hypothetical protein [Chryseobacterium sp. Tr-659]NIF06327.1 hypothetical protein [Chryseobacterium sp. Tr-659]
MKNRIFKYRIVGIVVFLFELFLLFLFGFGTYDSFIELSIERIFSVESFIFLFAAFIFISTLLSLISLILKNKKAILYLNLNYILIVLFFVSGYIKILIEKSFEEGDIFKLFFTFSVITAFLVITNVFKNKKVQFLELDDIGKRKD